MWRVAWFMAAAFLLMAVVLAIGVVLVGPMNSAGRTMLKMPIRKHPPKKTRPSPPKMIVAPNHPRASGRATGVA